MRRHGRGATPLEAPGRQDITCDVPLEHLRWAAERAGFAVDRRVAQAEWLRALGIDELVAEGEAIWRERAHIGDLAAIAGRSRGSGGRRAHRPDRPRRAPGGRRSNAG